jgi:4-carboxymuconolactone decarboxylase
MEVRAARLDIGEVGKVARVKPRQWLSGAIVVVGLAIAFPSSGLCKEKVSMDKIATRQQEILGQPPRVAPLNPHELGEQAQAIVARIRQAAGTPATGGIPEYVATFLKHPALYEKHVALGTELLGNGTLTARQRELAVLRTGWLCGAPYEWGEHVEIAKRAGLTSDEIERVTQGSEAVGWSKEDGAILRAAEELHASAMISDETWRILEEFLDERQQIELPYVIGTYTKVAFFQNALRLRLQKGNQGLSAR